MDRKGVLKMLVVSVRENCVTATRVLELLNTGQRERTYPHALERAFRAIEHDARVARLPRFADAAGRAKTVGRNVLKWKDPTDPLELLTEVVAEFRRAADRVEAGRQHMLDQRLMERLRKAAQGLTTEPSLSESQT